MPTVVDPPPVVVPPPSTGSAVVVPPPRAASAVVDPPPSTGSLMKALLAVTPVPQWSIASPAEAAKVDQGGAPRPARRAEKPPPPPWREPSSAGSSTDVAPQPRDWWKPPEAEIDYAKEIERLLVTSIGKDREKEDMEREKRAKVDTAANEDMERATRAKVETAATENMEMAARAEVETAAKEDTEMVQRAEVETAAHEDMEMVQRAKVDTAAEDSEVRTVAKEEMEDEKMEAQSGVAKESGAVVTEPWLSVEINIPPNQIRCIKFTNTPISFVSFVFESGRLGCW